MAPFVAAARVAAAVGLAGPAARAADGDPIAGNAYAVDLVQGPVLAPLRVTGLGGAFAAYAEGVDAMASNAAAPAVREPYSVRWLDWDYTAGLYLPATFRTTDFDNDGRAGFVYDDFLFYTLGAGIKAGPFGLGALGDFQRYNLSPNANPGDPRIHATLARLHVLGGVQIARGAVTVGGGARAVSLSVEASGGPFGAAGDNVLSMRGVAPELGILVRPDWLPWRIGATWRAPVDGRPAPEAARSRDTAGVVRAAGFAVPEVVRLPWEVEVGFALQVGPRPLNPAWIDPREQEAALAREIARERAERRAAREAELRSIADPAEMHERARAIDADEDRLRAIDEARLARASRALLEERRARYRNWPRERITVLGSLLVTGPSENAVSLESFFAQRERRAGERATYAPRVGFESEPVPNRLQARFGTYVEPSRFAGRVARQHFTFGLDVRLFEWDLFGLAEGQSWRLSGAMDLAPRYEALGLSIGAWH